jgi:hypothetical protein
MAMPVKSRGLGENDTGTWPDPVNHPKHYTSSPARCKCGAAIECIQVVEHLPFNSGNAIKYLWRADEKGRPLEDLRKAAWYVNREIERRTKRGNAKEEAPDPAAGSADEDLDR